MKVNHIENYNDECTIMAEHYLGLADLGDVEINLTEKDYWFLDFECLPESVDANGHLVWDIMKVFDYGRSLKTVEDVKHEHSVENLARLIHYHKIRMKETLEAVVDPNTTSARLRLGSEYLESGSLYWPGASTDWKGILELFAALSSELKKIDGEKKH